MGSRDQIQLDWLGSKPLYLLSHLTGPSTVFLNEREVSSFFSENFIHPWGALTPSAQTADQLPRDVFVQMTSLE